MKNTGETEYCALPALPSIADMAKEAMRKSLEDSLHEITYPDFNPANTPRHGYLYMHKENKMEESK